MIPAAIERSYPKRLPKVGCWHMSLYQRPARELSVQANRKDHSRYGGLSHGPLGIPGR